MVSIVVELVLELVILLTVVDYFLKGYTLAGESEVSTQL